MDPAWLRQLLADVAGGQPSAEGALASLRRFPAAVLQDARIDHQRELRTGLPEVIFGAGKTPAQILEIAAELLAASGRFLATRVAADAADALGSRWPAAHHDASGRTFWFSQRAVVPPVGHVVVATAGTTDLPVAREALATLEFLGDRADLIVDVGVAGIHRLLAEETRLRAARVVIVIAGMEGALASVVGGLVACPVIAVPTSTGYGAAFDGLAALLAMLSSCAPGISVVNIDGGFSAACVASRINRMDSI